MGAYSMTHTGSVSVCITRMTRYTTEVGTVLIWRLHSVPTSCVSNISVMRGDYKRRKTAFMKGHKKYFSTKDNVCWSDSDIQKTVEYVRPTAEEASLLQNPPIIPEAMPQASHKPSVIRKFLRSRDEQPCTSQCSMSSPPSVNPNSVGCYKLFHTEKLWTMMNAVTKDHMFRNPKCNGNLSFDEEKQEQRALVWRQRAKCDLCNYRSGMYKLYNEVETNKPGRRSATANIGFNIALTQTPIAATSVIKMCLAANIPAPSEKGMQNCASKVCEMAKTTNIMDMRCRRQKLRRINHLRNRPPNEVVVESDGMYNNNLYSGVGKTPFQPATQCTYTVAENITNKKQIIALETVNKLCSKHGFHTQTDDECDIKSGPCTSTAAMETNIGDEQQWADLCFRDLHEDGLDVKVLTTDGDTKAYQAAVDLYNKNIISDVPEFFLDTRHLAENHRKQMKKSVHVLKMMPGKTKTYRQFLQNRFSIDLSKRCQAEFETVHSQEKGNFSRVMSRINKCIMSIKRCYSGDHSFCRWHSTVCKGEPSNNWIHKSSYLPSTFKINRSEHANAETLIECIEYRLSDDTLKQTKYNLNTQKVESTNKSIKRSLPKTTTFSRNFSGRAHSAIHCVNNGPGESLQLLCSSAGCPIPRGGKVHQQLAAIQRLSLKKKLRGQSIQRKLKRQSRQNRLYKLYEKHREERKYIHAQLLKKLRTARKIACSTEKYNVPSTSTDDHTDYPRNPRNNHFLVRKRHGGSCRPTQAPASTQ